MSGGVREDPAGFGLVGHPVGHSVSSRIHELVLRELNDGATYGLIDVDPARFDDQIPKIIAAHKGLNVTVPYKQRVFAHLAGASLQAQAIGAVNTVYRSQGYNTDILGFRDSLKGAFDRGFSGALVLGAGGAARSVVFGLAELGVFRFLLLHREGASSQDRARVLAENVAAHCPQARIELCTASDVLKKAERLAPDLVVNTTPCGMYPHTKGLPLAKDRLTELFLTLKDKGLRLAYDAIYNPPATGFLFCANACGIPAQNGLEMLVLQAVEAEKIWHPDQKDALDCFDSNGTQTPFYRSLLAHAHEALLDRFSYKFVLTGFMGAGKTTIGRAFHERLPRNVAWIDLDEQVERRAGMPIPRHFEELGEKRFRELERYELERALKDPGAAVISCGGGTLVQPHVSDLLGCAATQVIWCDAPLETLLARVQREAGTRPLARDKARFAQLYEERKPGYKALSDVTIDTTQHVERCVDELMVKLKLEW